MAGKIIFNNKYLLDYIFEFDDTYKQKFKKDLVLSKVILGAVNNYWYKRYERELYEKNDTNLVFELQDMFFNTLFLWDPELIGSIRMLD
jgi:hypothetical protein